MSWKKKLQNYRVQRKQAETDLFSIMDFLYESDGLNEPEPTAGVGRNDESTSSSLGIERR